MNIHPSASSQDEESSATIQRANDVLSAWEEQKEAKREANRWKHICEELVGENIQLKRQVQILDSIPDSIVAFELSGRIVFVSHSFLDFLGLSKAHEIEDTSFWEQVTEDSKNGIRSAFTDALIEDTPSNEDDSVPLAEGRSLHINFVVKDEQGRRDRRLGSLKGMVHVNEGVPECVCSIRPITHSNQLKHVTSSAVFSLSGVSDDGKVSPKGTQDGERKRTAVSVKEARVGDFSTNQVSETDSAK
jgi:PAS domain S-box-containing protein